MSEFYKALEQAERDRVRQDQGEARTAPPVARTSPRENGTAAAAPEAIVAGPAARPQHFPKPPSTISAPPPASAPAAAPSPASVFRPSLRKPAAPRLGRRHAGRQPVLIAETDPSSIEADAYRTLRANIELMSGDGLRHIAITSAAGGDGKSTTAANLAVVAAQGGRRVCLVDADLRRPVIHEIFGLPNVDGLALALAKGKSLEAVARPADIANLSIVVAGHGVDEGYHAVLTAQRLEQMLGETGTAFDLMIFDGPPIVAADALSVAAVSDGVIIVVRAGSIPFSVLRRAIGQVKQVKGRVLGVLLNQADLRSADADSYRYYSAYSTTDAKS